MPETQVKGRNIGDGSVGRPDLNVATSGQAVITKVVEVANSGIRISSFSGADTGTGDVGLAIDTTYLSTLYQTKLNGTGLVRMAGTVVSYDNTTYFHSGNLPAYLPIDGTANNANAVGTISPTRIVYGSNNSATSVITGTDVNLLYKAGFYSGFGNTNNFHTGDFGLVNIPTWPGTDANNRYNLQIGAAIGGVMWYRSTGSDGSGTWKSVWDSSNFTPGNYSTTGHTHDYATHRGGEAANVVDYARFVYNNGTYSGTGWTEPSDLGVRYANSAGKVVNYIPHANTIASPTGNWFYTDYGYIALGPMNAGTAHIYTDLGSFYFNKDLLVLGNLVYHTGNLNIANYSPVGHTHEQYVHGHNESGQRAAPQTWDAYHDSQRKGGFWDIVNAAWAPTTDWWWGITAPHGSNNAAYNYSGQLVFNLAGTESYFRSISGGTANGWKRIWHDGNFTPTNYALTGHDHTVINGVTIGEVIGGSTKKIQANGYDFDIKEGTGTYALRFGYSSANLSWNGTSITTTSFIGDLTGNALTSSASYKLAASLGWLSHPGSSAIGYSTHIVNPTSGLFPAVDNSNSILSINRHSGDYNSQLGFSSNGNMYYRSYANEAINTTKAWRQVWDAGNFTPPNQTLDTTSSPTFAALTLTSSFNSTTTNSNFFASDLTIGYSTYQGYKLAVNGIGYFSTGVTANGNVTINTSGSPYQYYDSLNITSEGSWGLRLQAHHNGGGYDYKLVQKNNGTDYDCMTFLGGNVTFAGAVTAGNISSTSAGINYFKRSNNDATDGLVNIGFGSFSYTMGAMGENTSTDTVFVANNYSHANAKFEIRVGGVLASHTKLQILQNGNAIVAGSVTAGGVLTAGAIVTGSNLVRPNAKWGATSATGPVIIKFPGDANSYGMVHCVIDIYEYSGNNVSTVVIGGHNWGNQWYSYGANLVGYTEKPIRVAFKDGQYCIVIGDANSSWSYGQVVLRKISNGEYYTGQMNLSATFTVGIGTDTYSWVSENLSGLRSSKIYSASTIAASGVITSASYFKSESVMGLVGNYDISSTADKSIWTIGAEWNTIATMYGIGYDYNVKSGFAHSIFFASAGVKKAWISLNSGSAHFNGIITADGSGTFTGGGFNSRREIKDIHADWSGKALEVISKFKIRDFNYKNVPDHDRTLGFIVDEIPEEVGDYVLSGATRNAINTYTLHGLSFKAHQETKTELELQAEKIIVLENRVRELEGREN